MDSSKIYEPNRDIPIADTEITSIDGQVVKVPACAILKLLPQPSIVIEVENVPPKLIRMEEFHISLQNGTPIPVYYKQFNMQSSNGFKTNGILTLAKSHLTVLDMKKYLQVVQFTILNFPFPFNKIHLEADGWLVEITALPNLKYNLETLKSNGGYSITHTGLVKKSDEGTFSVNDCKQFLKGLEWFLSFVRGTNCALTLVKGYDQCSEMSWSQWGPGAVDPWLYEESWLPNVIGNSILSKVFSGFWDQLKNKTWTDTTRCLDWYISSNTSNASHVRIVLNQASLEALCSMICSSKKTFVSKLRCTLNKLNINTEVPLHCRELEKIQKRIQDGDGPRTIYKIRNDLVHSEHKLGTVSSEAYWETLNLSRWYVEMMLLYKFKHMGKYWNRITHNIELVPWAEDTSS